MKEGRLGCWEKLGSIFLVDAVILCVDGVVLPASEQTVVVNSFLYLRTTPFRCVMATVVSVCLSTNGGK